jgi:hypothetical protein
MPIVSGVDSTAGVNAGGMSVTVGVGGPRAAVAVAVGGTGVDVGGTGVGVIHWSGEAGELQASTARSNMPMIVEYLNRRFSLSEQTGLFCLVFKSQTFPSKLFQIHSILFVENNPLLFEQFALFLRARAQTDLAL